MSDAHSAGAQAPYTLEWVQRQEPVTRREILETLATRGDEAAIAILVACLSDDHPAVQQKAVDGLIRIGNDAVLRHAVTLLRESPAVRMMAIEIIQHVRTLSFEALRPALESADPSVRKLVVDALGVRCGREAATWLFSMLNDADPNVRAAVAEALGRLRTIEAVPGLISMLSGDEWPAFFAASALGEIGDPAAIPALKAAIRRDQPALACAAIDALGRIDREGILMSEIAGLVGHPDRAVRWTVVRAVVAMAAVRGIRAWATLDRATWSEVLVEAIRESERGMKMAGIRGLGLLGDRKGTRAILSAYRALKDVTDEERDVIVSALAETGDTDVLVKAIELDEDRVSDAAIRAVGQLRCREALPALNKIRHKSWDWQRRKATLQAMAHIGTDEALAFVCEGVDDATGYVRAEAARLVSECGRPGYVRRVLVKLQSERYEDVRLEMAKALLKAGTHEVMVELVDMLRYGPAPIRETAAWAIGSVRLPEGLDPLVKALNDPDWKVRRAVIEGLTNYREDEAALRVLLVGLTDGHEKVRLAATTGLAQRNRPEVHRALLNVAQYDPDVWVRRCAIDCLGSERIAEAVCALGQIARDGKAPQLLRSGAVEALHRIGGEEAEAAVAASGIDVTSLPDRSAA